MRKLLLVLLLVSTTAHAGYKDNYTKMFVGTEGESREDRWSLGDVNACGNTLAKESWSFRDAVKRLDNDNVHFKKYPNGYGLWYKGELVMKFKCHT